MKKLQANTPKLLVNGIKLIVVAIFLLFASSSLQAQTQCPSGMVCISQAAANQAAENARELSATKAKITTLTEALAEKDKIIADVRATASKNEADLKEALTKTQTELATKTGQLIGCEANSTRQLAVIDVLLKNVRPKKIGLINF